MTYRKGEKPVSRPLDRWSPIHPVAHMIATGDRWFDAWSMQNATPIGRLSKVTGIPGSRLMTISGGRTVSRAEVEALALAWCISAADLAASMPVDVQVID